MLYVTTCKKAPHLSLKSSVSNPDPEPDLDLNPDPDPERPWIRISILAISLH